MNFITINTKAMKKITAFFLIAFFVFACANKSESKTMLPPQKDFDKNLQIKTLPLEFDSNSFDGGIRFDKDQTYFCYGYNKIYYKIKLSDKFNSVVLSYGKEGNKDEDGNFFGEEEKHMVLVNYDKKCNIIDSLEIAKIDKDEPADSKTSIINKDGIEIKWNVTTKDGIKTITSVYRVSKDGKFIKQSSDKEKLKIDALPRSMDLKNKYEKIKIDAGGKFCLRENRPFSDCGEDSYLHELAEKDSEDNSLRKIETKKLSKLSFKKLPDYFGVNDEFRSGFQLNLSRKFRSAAIVVFDGEYNRFSALINYDEKYNIVDAVRIVHSDKTANSDDDDPTNFMDKAYIDNEGVIIIKQFVDIGEFTRYWHHCKIMLDDVEDYDYQSSVYKAIYVVADDGQIMFLNSTSPKKE